MSLRRCLFLLLLSVHVLVHVFLSAVHLSFFYNQGLCWGSCAGVVT